MKVKICGLCRLEDARVAARAGADYLGVVFAAGPRRQSLESAARIFAVRAEGRVGVFADAGEREVARAAEALGLAVVQLHGEESPEYCRRVRGAGPWSVWKAVRFRGGDLAAAAAEFAQAVDAVLIEGWSPQGWGGTGTSVPLAAARAARAAWPNGLGLVAAGGLTPENVAEIVRLVRPDVVDVSSGVEARVGAKDGERVRAFVRNARSVE